MGCHRLRDRRHPFFFSDHFKREFGVVLNIGELRIAYCGWFIVTTELDRYTQFQL